MSIAGSHFSAIGMRSMYQAYSRIIGMETRNVNSWETNFTDSTISIKNRNGGMTIP